ncbi:MAG: DUF3375 domain-containing protein, partial [Deltaproteobacteria bacterium]|nr:DUF3375 domain-containing protein [Deltaproteobacteria bacterium]
MEYDYLDKLKQTHPTLKLLAAGHAPLIISFLHKIFIEPNLRSLAETDVITRLNDYLFHLRQIYGDEKFPKTGKEYLNDWSNGKTPFLRKYYTNLSDEPEFDLTPATEKAIEWLQSLEAREFVGTESRLLTVFTLLRELVSKSHQDPQERIAALRKQQREIDIEIEKIESGITGVQDSTQVKERFLQVEETARRLLADFRQVEHNFRSLDRDIREQIAINQLGKGMLLDDVFAKQDLIWEGDQGKSFRAFWEFLMSSPRQEELLDLLDKVYALDAVQELSPSHFLRQIKYALLEAGEKVYKTNNQLVEQLRKFLDDQTYLENRRIMELVKEIEQQAILLKENVPLEKDFNCVDNFRPEVDLVMARGLFRVTKEQLVVSDMISAGEAQISVDSLFVENHVDEQVLRAGIRQVLQQRSQASLAQIVAEIPLSKGVAEVVTYLHIAEKDDSA